MAQKKQKISKKKFSPALFPTLLGFWAVLLIMAAIYGSKGLWLPLINSTISYQTLHMENTSVPLTPSSSLTPSHSSPKDDDESSEIQHTSDHMSQQENAEKNPTIYRTLARLDLDLSQVQSYFKLMKEKHGLIIDQQTQLKDHLNQLDNHINELKDRMTKLDKQMQETALPQIPQHYIMLNLNFLTLTQAIYAHQPFQYYLNIFIHNTPEKSSIRKQLEQLIPYSIMGIPHLSELQISFEKLMKLTLYHQAPQDNAPWREKITFYLKKWLSFKHLDPKDPISLEGRLHQAQINLQKNHVSVALNHVQKLSPQAQKIMEPWIEKARAYVTCTNTLDALSQWINQLMNHESSTP